MDFGLWETDSLIQNIWVINNSPDSLKITGVEKRTEFFGIKSDLPVTISSGDSVELGFWFNPQNAETGNFNDVLTICSDSENKRIARQVKVSGRQFDNIAPVAQLLSADSEFPTEAKIQIEISEALKISDGNELDYNSIDSYILFKKNNNAGVPVNFNATISTDKKIITIVPETELEKATTYYLGLKSGLMDYSGNDLELFEEQFSTVLTSVENKLNDLKVKVYPNPATTKIVINTSRNENGFTYKIFNSTGNLVKTDVIASRKLNEEIDISFLKRGIYILITEIDNNSEIHKIVKY